jgi:hypothetical protein
MSFLAAFAFTFVAMVALLYSVAIYLYRSSAIRNRRAIKYHDKYGPTALCAILFVAVILDLWYEAGTRGFLGENWTPDF